MEFRGEEESSIFHNVYNLNHTVLAANRKVIAFAQTDGWKPQIVTISNRGDGKAEIKYSCSPITCQPRINTDETQCEMKAEARPTTTQVSQG